MEPKGRTNRKQTGIKKGQCIQWKDGRKGGKLSFAPTGNSVSNRKDSAGEKWTGYYITSVQRGLKWGGEEKDGAQLLEGLQKFSPSINLNEVGGRTKKP